MSEPHVFTVDDHRRLAAVTYNDCWDLLEIERTPQQDRDLIGLALTSRYHWQHAGGGDEELVIADWMVGRAFAAIGAGGPALDFARAAVAGQTTETPPWLQASLQEGLARAFSASGEKAERDAAVVRARELLTAEPDPESRELIQGQLDTVP
jgi:hypothetical protein